MQPYKRTQRLNILLREEIADLIMRKVKDPRLGFVTVTDVEITNDLKIAKVFISFMNDADIDISMEILDSAKGFIRSELSKRVRLKYIPSLEFKIDKSVRHGSRIDELLREIKDKDEAAP
jgi:ribosome-binding factor A